MKVLFMGTPDFAGEILKKLIDEKINVVGVCTQPDRKVGRKRVLTPTPVKVIATKANIKVIQPENIKTDYDEIVNLKPDLIITAAYGQIVPQAVLDIPKLGCINVHASLLPKYRGGAPIHYAILNGDKETGVTIMYMVKKMDAGNIISQNNIPIEQSDNVGTMFEKLATLGADLLIDTLPSIVNGTNISIPQNEDEVTYAYAIKREQEFIDFNKSSKQVFDKIRAFNPWPIATSTIDNINIKIYNSVIIGKTDKEAGTIISLDKTGITVATGDGKSIKLTDIQVAGKKRMDIASLLNGVKDLFVVGKKFV